VRVRIYADIPDPDGNGPLFSMPGGLLWEYVAAPYMVADSLGLQSWYDPLTGNFLPNNHVHYYKNQLDVPLALQFNQTFGTIYWLALSVELPAGSPAKIGWKTSAVLHLDKNVYLDNTTWRMIPNNPVADSSFAFKLTGNTDDECPVEHSSFQAISPVSGKVQLKWVTQSETELAGYRVYRNSTSELNTASCCTTSLIAGTNTSMQQSYQFEDTDVEDSSTYWYWLESVDLDGAVEVFGPVSVLTAAPDSPDTPIVASSLLLGANPNPFTTNSSTTIRFSTSKDMNTNISIYNLKGQLVRTLANGQMTVGAHQLNWDGKNDQGQFVTAGVYFYRMQTSDYLSTRKLILIK
jgi:hypothetical protein